MKKITRKKDNPKDYLKEQRAATGGFLFPTEFNFPENMLVTNGCYSYSSYRGWWTSDNTNEDTKEKKL